MNAAGEREAVEKTFGIANGIFFAMTSMNKKQEYLLKSQIFFIFISRAPSAHSNNKQQPKQQQQQPKEKEEEEEETKCRFVVVRRINLPPSLSSLAHLSLGSDSRDGVLVFF